MIHIPIWLAGLVWYYDPELRKFVYRHAKPVEQRVRKICKSVIRRKVNRKTDDSEE